MQTEFDANLPGRHTYDLSKICLETNEFGNDTLTCINNGKGPSIVLCGGIHGDEYEPQIVLRRLLASLKTEDVKGRLIVIPSLNFPAAHAGKRVSTHDGLNMNRTFPGDRHGSVTQRISAFLHDAVFPHCDLLIDVHAGGSGCVVVPMVFGWTSSRCSMSAHDLDGLMEQWGYPYVQHVPIVDSTSCGAALIADIPSIEIEGGGGALTAVEMDLMFDGLLRGLRACGVLKGGQTATGARPGIHVDALKENEYVAPVAGIVEHKVKLHDAVEEGQVVAVMHSVDGTFETQDVVSKRAGIVLRLSTLGYVAKGAFVGNTGTPRA